MRISTKLAVVGFVHWQGTSQRITGRRHSGKLLNILSHCQFQLEEMRGHLRERNVTTRKVADEAGLRIAHD